MTPQQFMLLVRLMEEIDKGKEPPRLPGSYGHFLRQYAHERADIVQLAIREGIEIRRDGTISGRSFGRVSLVPLFPEDSSRISDSHWGQVGRYLALCPELLSPVVLRVWLSSQSGRDAFRELEAARGILHMYGDFRWLPPGVVTTGTADFEMCASGTESSWVDAPFLKVTGDDLTVVPHALDHLDVYLRGRPVLAHIRCALILRRDDGRAAVPGGLRPKLAPLQLASQSDVEALSESGSNLVLGLIYREPGEASWHVWRVVTCDADGALAHNARWIRFQRRLCGEELEGRLLEGAAAALEYAGVRPQRIEWPAEDHELDVQDSHLATFAKDVVRVMRVGPQ